MCGLGSFWEEDAGPAPHPPRGAAPPPSWVGFILRDESERPPGLWAERLRVPAVRLRGTLHGEGEK